MEIQEIILSLKRAFWADTGKIPTNLYVGHQEWWEIQAKESEGKMDLQLSLTTKGGNPITMGMSVFLVGLENHLGIGIGL